MMTLCVCACYFILMRHFRKNVVMFIFFFKARLTVAGLLPKLFIGRGKNKRGGCRKESLSNGCLVFSQGRRVKQQFSIQVPVVLSYARTVQSVHVTKI